ncbi:MAG TPA: hypothetical protein VGD54_07575, partial [Steroidobacteraceae bacterium]
GEGRLAMIVLRHVSGFVAETTKLRDALTKINEIRNSIIGVQGFNFSEHAYPLVAILDAAGFKGLPYPEAKANLGTLLERNAKLKEALKWAMQSLEPDSFSYDEVSGLYSCDFCEGEPSHKPSGFQHENCRYAEYCALIVTVS